MSQCVTISFFRMDRLSARLWAFAMMGMARTPLSPHCEPQLLETLWFWAWRRLFPTLFPKNYAILCVWPDQDTARETLANTPIFARYADQAAEDWTVYLSPTSARGAWSGEAPFETDGSSPKTSLAALTRATIRPRIALKFWGQVPSISQVIANDPNVAFKIGIGEVPFLQQVTFSIWPDTKTMANFARTDGPHARAIKAVRDGEWFKEELYARFDVTGSVGTWNGRNPLDQLDTAA